IDKLIRFALLPRNGEPIIWDFGSAARHHQMYNPWLDFSAAHSGLHGDDNGHSPHHGARVPPTQPNGSRPGISTLRVAFPPQAGIAEEVARKIRVELEAHELLSEPLGVDVIELPILFALQAAGIHVVDGQQTFLAARRVKTEDELTMLSTSAAMVD